MTATQKAGCSTMRDYLELTKPRLTMLALVATLVGVMMASYGPVDWPLALATVLGAALVGAGGNALNQWYERDTDARMARTASRPLPAGRLSPTPAAVFGGLLALAGVALLWWRAHPLAAGLAALTCISYVAVYTPLKRVTALCTLIGAVPGAMPPLIGWVAVRGRLDLDAWILFSMLFLWQLPHFLAIAWMYREEYERAGLQMLPLIDVGDARTARQMVLYSVALLPASLFPTVIGLSGLVYFVGALLLGVWFIMTAVIAARRQTAVAARQLFLSSVSYLPIVLAIMVADRGLGG